MTETSVERMLPLYEAKMIHHYDHRWATYELDGSIRNVTAEEKQDADFVVIPRYWVRREVVGDRLHVGDAEAELLGLRDICRSTDERTVIAAPFPACAVGNNLPIVLGDSSKRLSVVLSSFALDFVARPKVGGVHLNFFIADQLPVLPPSAFEATPTWLEGPLGSWLDRRAQWLQGVAGWSDPQQRAAVRAEIDALVFHLYAIKRDDVDYIMETFPIVKRKDIAAHGEYRTKHMILDVYDRMAEAIRTGTPYSSPFDAVSISAAEQ